MEDFKNAKILVIDDQAHNRDLVRFFLQQDGYCNFLEASTADQAFELAYENIPDIIFLDIQLEEESGFDVCKRLKENNKTKDIPVLFLSAYSETENKVHGYKLGAVDFVHKPINHYELIARTKVHLKNGQLLKQLQGYQNRIRYELDKAEKAQQATIPDKEYVNKIESFNNLKVESVYQSSSELAGDYWKAFQVDDSNVAFVLADFSGHGVYSALNTVRLDLLISRLEKRVLKDPVKVIKSLNTSLYKILPQEDFCAIVYLIYNKNSGLVEYVASNTPDLYMLKHKKGSKPKAYKGRGFPLGISKTINAKEFTHKHLQLEKGDCIMMYSDALLEESHKNGDRWLEEGLYAVLLKIQQEQEPGEKFQKVLQSFEDTVEKPLTDDLTMLSITRL